MKYSYEYRKIRSNYNVSVLAHSSANVILEHQYIPERCIGILDMLEFYKQYGIYSTRRILQAGDHAITLTLENRTSEIVQCEAGCVLAELRIINIDKILENAEAE